ncbi:hypothetical protein HAHE_13800 [Haloferula helveola]|uniref:Uncharacterized protein n=1 Tax=Haloferula helveola TaxID=490095 RepID=A0ABM7REV2_9BACT|nr:hypothetical protein HAHE_13800 [Haloferula helveola]
MPEAVDQGAAEKDPVAAGEPPEVAPEARMGWGIGIHGDKKSPAHRNGGGAVERKSVESETNAQQARLGL